MKNEIEIKIELNEDEFNLFSKKSKNRFVLERTFGYFQEDFSNVEKGIFPRIKQICGKKIVVGIKLREKKNSKYFERKEFEYSTKEENLQEARSIFLNIGFSKEIIFEKKRKEVLIGELSISLDVLPFGKYMEIEGSKKAIKNFLMDNNLHRKKRINKSYLGLWSDFNKGGEKDCVFNEAPK